MVVGAPTGTAADNVRKGTLHSLFKLTTAFQRQSAPRVVYTLVAKIRADLGEEEDVGASDDPIVEVPIVKLTDALIEEVRHMQVLVVDEVSMLGMSNFELIDELFKTVNGNDLPFGGVQVVFVGDFLQLPPVKDSFCFLSPKWAEANLKTSGVTEILRADPSERRWMQVLSEMRSGAF